MGVEQRSRWGWGRKAVCVLASGRRAPEQPGLHKRLGQRQSPGPEILGIQHPTGAATRLLEKVLEKAAGHPAKGHTRRHPGGLSTALQQPQRAQVGATGQLQGPRRGQAAQAIEQLHGGMGRAGTDVTTHRPPIQLPQRQKSFLAKPLMAPPEAGGQGLNGVGRLQAAADGHPPQGNAGLLQLRHPFGKGAMAANAGVNLHRIRLQLPQQGGDGLSLEDMLVLADQPVGTGRQAATASVATFHQHAGTCRNRQRGADPLTGARAMGRTTAGIKPGLAEMGIGAIAEADHQPGRRWRTAIEGPADASAGGRHDRSISGDIETMHSSQAEQASKVFEGLEILVAGATDHLHPSAGCQSLLGPWGLALRRQEAAAGAASAGRGLHPSPPRCAAWAPGG